MDSLVGYGSDDEIDSERFGRHSVGGAGMRRREDDTNYDSVNMDMSEESQAESEPELPPADCEPPHGPARAAPHEGTESERPRDRDHEHQRDPDRDHERQRDPDRDWRRDTARRDDRTPRSERSERRRGLLGDRPEPRARDQAGEAAAARTHGARDAASPRFADRERAAGDRGDRRDLERDRERDRGRDSRGRRSQDRRSGRGERSRSRGAGAPERRASPSDYRPSSYKVNKKLEVMEKMGLQIKTPDGSMATAQQLRAAADRAPALGGAGARVLQQVQKRKLLWAGKGKPEAEAAKWSGTRFAQDSDGKQASKFMRLMGIKEPAAAGGEAAGADPTRKQEELFQAMQAQYDVARAATHTMRGVGLGFTRNHF